MKIYNKSAFLFGVFLAGALFVFALGIISVDWWQWVIITAFSGKYLYAGLSKTANENANTIRRSYKETASKLYGKYALIKTNLPMILLAIFFGAALFIRYAFDIVTPVGIAIIFCILLTSSVAYSIGLDRNIKKAIAQKKGINQDEG